MSDKEPGSASFANRDRWTTPHPDDPDVQVVVEGTVCPARVLGRNGPRVQLRFQLGGASYVRWFDRSEVLET